MRVRWRGVNYVLAAAIVAMSGCIVVLTLRLRADRVRHQRQRSRGRFAFRPRERARFLLGRAFKPIEDKPDWQDALLSGLREVQAARRRELS